MKSKKLLVMVLGIILILVLAGCNKTSTNKSKNIVKDKKTETVKEKDSDEENVEVDDFETDATIEKTTIIDTKGIKVIVKDLSYNEYEVEIGVLIENNSKKDIEVTSGALGYSCNSINNYMIDDGYINEAVAKGKKVNSTITFDIDNLLAYGITQIADFYIGFEVDDSNSNNIITSGKKIKTNKADTYDYDTDVFLKNIKNGVFEELTYAKVKKVDTSKEFSKDGVEMISQVYVEKESGEKIVFIELENTSDEIKQISSSDIMMNDIVVCDSTWNYEYIMPKTKVVMDINIGDVVEEEIIDVINNNEFTGIGYVLNLHKEDSDKYYSSNPIKFVTSNNNKKKRVKRENIYAKKDIAIYYLGKVSTEDDDSEKLLFAVENKRKNEINAQLADNGLSINGFMVDCYKDIYVSAKQTALFEVEISEEDLEENDIENIKDVEVKFEIENDDYDIIAEPLLKIKVK